MKFIFWTPTMKLFLNTAVLCAIPKFVNAAEAKIKEWSTPDDQPPTFTAEEVNKILEEQEVNNLAVEEMNRQENKNTIIQLEQEIRKELGAEFDTALTKKIEKDAQTAFEAQKQHPQKIIEKLPPTEGTAWGPSSNTIYEGNQATSYNDSVNGKKDPEPIKSSRAPFTKNMAPITKEIHDKINEVWTGMLAINTTEGRTKGAFPYCMDDAARTTNEYFDTDWGVSTLTKCLRAPGCKTRIERDDCPSQAEVDGEVTRSVSEFSKMNKLNIKTKKET